MVTDLPGYLGDSKIGLFQQPGCIPDAGVLEILGEAYTGMPVESLRLETVAQYPGVLDRIG